MFSISRRLVRTLTPAAVAVGLSLPSTGFAETLKLAHFVPPFHVVTKSVVEPLADGVKKDSDGALDIMSIPAANSGRGRWNNMCAPSTGSPTSPSVWPAIRRPSFPGP